MFTTSVQSHLLQLSGNKTLISSKKILIALTVTLGVTSCTPKVGVLKSPDYNSTSAQGNSSKEGTNQGSLEHSKKNKFDQKNIALLLPFQLHQINPTSLDAQDVKRSALSLDFYQGFELGLEELSKHGAGFNLDVIDSRDNVRFVTELATSSKLEDASLVVGPVFPQEIKSFGTSFKDKEVLQVNPLSAAMPSEYNLSNLVSLTPPIKAHSEAIAGRVAKLFLPGDIIIVYHTGDSDSRQFLTGMSAAIKQFKSSAQVISVNTLSELNSALNGAGKNYVIAGTTDKNSLKGLVDNLLKQYQENYYKINLFGHPLWDRYDFSMYPGVLALNTTITTESNLKPWTSEVKQFKENYYESFGVNPSDASYKGYDTAIYFGKLLEKFGAANLKDKLTKEHYSGIYNSYKFKHNPVWGYMNEAVFFKVYQGNSFQLQ